MLPVIVTIGELDAFTLQDNIIYIFPSHFESLYKLKMLIISPSNTHWRPNQRQVVSNEPLVIVSPGPLGEHRPTVQLLSTPTCLVCKFHLKCP